jgi:hypothetical protein
VGVVHFIALSAAPQQDRFASAPYHLSRLSTVILDAHASSRSDTSFTRKPTKGYLAGAMRAVTYNGRFPIAPPSYAKRSELTSQRRVDERVFLINMRLTTLREAFGVASQRRVNERVY